jgi:hypothetical protein
MDITSVTYVLCRIEDDSSLTRISEHDNVADGVAAGKHQIEVEDFDFGYGLFADGVRVASFAEGRTGYREWARRNGRLGDIHSLDDRFDHDVDETHGVIVVATRLGSCEERTCSQCFEGRVYDIQRGAWVACERCSGIARVMVFLYPKLNRRSR